MFEEELEMEKRQSSVVPLLLIVVLIVGVVGLAGYYVVQSRKVLTEQEATSLVNQALQVQGPAAVRFHTGTVKTSMDDARGPQYRLLEKAGVLQLGKGNWAKIPVALTPKGEEMLKQIAGVSESKEQDGTSLYRVPLATRKLVGAPKVTMTGSGRAAVEITWKWETNPLGEDFDATGPMVKAFTTYERGQLIEKYGANFYHGDPGKLTLVVIRGDKGWQVAGE